MEPNPTLAALEMAIQKSPESPVNYFLRGEMYLELGIIEAAREDFETAIRLAERAQASASWEFIFQSYQDRAAIALQKLSES